jgi:hypothetical protein
VEALRAAGNEVIVFDQPYNRHLDGLRARSWREVEELVLEHLISAGYSVQQQFTGLDDGAARVRGALRGSK